MILKYLKAATCGTVIIAGPVVANGSVSAEVSYLFNTLLLLICGVLVMFMAAGFAMLEAGMVRSKSVSVILAKNITLYAVASIMFYILGYELMYGSSLHGLIGEFKVWLPKDLALSEGATEPSSASWFFQMVFVATAASIVSGALAERIKFWPFFVFVMLLTSIIYPIVGHWTWGQGWLFELGFSDFAGSTIVHSVGGWAALAGIIMLGARKGRFGNEKEKKSMAPSSLPMVTLGTFILWLGWFGFNGGSQLAFSTTADALAVATIFVNTNAAAAGGVVAVTLLSQLLFKKLNLPFILNGALAGLVSITAGPVEPSLGQSIVIGAIGGGLMLASSLFMEKIKLDDVVGAVPVHLVAGIWGTLAVCLTHEGVNFSTQLIGILVVGLFTFFVSLCVWLLLRKTCGIRLKAEHEEQGADLSDVGMRAYNIKEG